MPTTTTNYGFTKPDVGQTTSWGTQLNADLDSIDSLIKTNSDAIALKAPLASPTFTGTPVAPTPSTGDNSTTVATTAFVKAQNYLTSNAVTTVFGRSGAVVAASNDYAFSQLSGSASKAQLPGTTVFTDQANTFGAFVQTFQAGVNHIIVDPTDTTKKFKFDASNITTATTRTVNVPDANSTTVQSSSAAANQFATGVSAQGVVAYAQPSFTNISGTATAAQLPSTAVNSIVNDTNVTGSISAQALTLAWSGTLAKGRCLGTTVYTDQANTFGNFVQTFQGGANHLIVDPTDTTKKFKFDASNITTATTRTVNVPDANSTTVQASTAAANSFATAVSAQGIVTYTQPSFANISGTATSGQYVTMVGDSGSGGTKGAVPAPASGDAAANKFLKADGTWAVPSGGGGGGTVTSVTFTGDGTVLSSTPSSAVTTSGTVTGTLLTQTKNTVLVGPSSGSNAAPTFRALVGADLPNPSSSTLGGVQSATPVTSQWVNSINTSGVPQLSQPAHTDLTGCTGANGETWVVGSNTELLTLSTSGTTTDTSANLLPANSMIMSVVARITTTIATATDWKLGDANVGGRFTAANSTLTAGTTTVGITQLSGASSTLINGPSQAAAAKVRVTTTGTPSAGVIRITVFYQQWTAPTS